MAGIEGIIPVQQSFNGGEIGPLVAARIDQTRYLTGCKTMRNGFPLVQGPVTRRPGTRYLGAAKHSDKRIKLIPFVFSEEQARVLEFGPGYVRFWTEDGYLTGGERATKEYTANIKGGGGATGQGWEWKQPGTFNFTAPVSGMYELLCIGGGGGGYYFKQTFSNAFCDTPSGRLIFDGASGGGGGSATLTTFLSSGMVLAVTVGGGGGASSWNHQWGELPHGNSGGESLIGNMVGATGGGAFSTTWGQQEECKDYGDSGVYCSQVRCVSPHNGAGGVGRGSAQITQGGWGAGGYWVDYLPGGAGHMGYGNGGSSKQPEWADGPHGGGSGYCRIKFVG